jgi:hypothetical protein
VAHKLGATDLVDRRLDGSQSELGRSCSEEKLVNAAYGKWTYDSDKVVDTLHKAPVSPLHAMHIISTGDTSTKVMVM